MDVSEWGTLLSRLAHDPDERVRAGVAGNPSTPVSVLTELVRSMNSDLECAVGRNPAIPLELMEELLRGGALWTWSNEKALAALVPEWAGIPPCR